MIEDLGTILDKIRKREEAGCKSALKLHVLQGRSAAVVRKAAPKEWKNILHEATGLKKSTHYDRVNAWAEFGPLLMVQVDGQEGDDALDIVPDYASVTTSALKLLMKVAKGCDDNVKHEWLAEAAALSLSDLKAKVDEITGKEPHDCGPFTEIKAWKCTACNKVTAKAPDIDT
jgi:hypothetical protein